MQYYNDLCHFFLMISDTTKLTRLDKVVDGLDQSCAARSALIDAQLAMSINLIKFTRKEAPTFEKEISFAIAPLQKITKIEERELDAERRLADDFNDILARKRVINRLEQEQTNAMDAYKQAKLMFENAHHKLQMEYNQNSSGKTLQYAEDEYKKAKEYRSSTLENAKIATQRLIDEKQKFSRFMANRLKHGFEQYGDVLTTTANEKAEQYSKMNNNFSQLRQKIDTLAQGAIVNMPTTENSQTNTNEKIFESIKNPFDDIH